MKGWLMMVKMTTEHWNNPHDKECLTCLPKALPAAVRHPAVAWSEAADLLPPGDATNINITAHVNGKADIEDYKHTDTHTNTHHNKSTEVIYRKRWKR